MWNTTVLNYEVMKYLTHLSDMHPIQFSLNQYNLNNIIGNNDFCKKKLRIYENHFCWSRTFLLKYKENFFLKNLFYQAIWTFTLDSKEPNIFISPATIMDYSVPQYLNPDAILQIRTTKNNSAFIEKELIGGINDKVQTYQSKYSTIINQNLDSIMEKYIECINFSQKKEDCHKTIYWVNFLKI